MSRRPAAAHSRWLDRQAGIKGVDVPVPVLPGNVPWAMDKPKITTGIVGARDDKRSFLQVSWDELPKNAAETYEVRYKRTQEDELYITQPAERLNGFKIPDTQNNTEYEVQVRAISPKGAVGEWSEPTLHATAQDDVAPGLPEDVHYMAYEETYGHPSQARMWWRRAPERDWYRTQVKVRYEGGQWDETVWYVYETECSPGRFLYPINEEWPLPDDLFHAEIRHEDFAGNLSEPYYRGPEPIGYREGLSFGPSFRGRTPPSGGDDNEDDGEYFDGDPLSIDLTGDPNFSPDNLPGEDARELHAKALAWAGLPNGTRRPDPLLRMRAYAGGSGTANAAGQYQVARPLLGSGASITMAFMTTRDLRFLDFICAMWERAELAMEGPGAGRADASGPEQNSADGYKGITWGTSGAGKIVSNETGFQIRLEAGTKRGGIGLVILLCRANQHFFSPAEEPVGNRPAVPAYFKRIADSAEDFEMNHMRVKWTRYWNRQATSKPSIAQGAAMSALPGYCKKAFVHPMLNEALGSLARARAVGGAEWRSHADYAQARAIVRLILDDVVEVQSKGTVAIVNVRGRDVMYWGQRAQNLDYNQSGAKVRTGQFTAPGVYMGASYASLALIKALGADFISDLEMEMITQGCVIGFMAPSMVNNNLLSGNTTDSGRIIEDKIRKPDDGKPAPYPLAKLNGNGYGALMGWDDTGWIEQCVIKAWGGSRPTHNIDPPINLLFGRAIRDLRRRTPSV